MTKETFEYANELDREIIKITNTLERLERVSEFTLDPMTRACNIYVKTGMHDGDPIVQLSEGEAVCIRNALLAERERLVNKFENL